MIPASVHGMQGQQGTERVVRGEKGTCMVVSHTRSTDCTLQLTLLSVTSMCRKLGRVSESSAFCIGEHQTGGKSQKMYRKITKMYRALPVLETYSCIPTI